MNIPAYPTYGTYKDSGVEWIGEVPAIWSVER
jgi:type I restriction enzyme S subunit